MGSSPPRAAISTNLRRQKISPKQWKRFKDIIIKLYQENGYKLTELRNYMQERYGFNAEKHMYQKRLGNWGVRKYYSKEQKLQLFAHLYQAGDVPTDITINGKPPQWSRLQRPAKRHGKNLQLDIQDSGNMSYDSLFSTHQGLPANLLSPPHHILLSSNSIQREILQESPESQNVEFVLCQIYGYYQWYFREEQAMPVYSHHARLATVFDTINRALSCISSNRCFAFKLLHNACDHTEMMFKHQPFSDYRSVRGLLLQNQWSVYPDLQERLIRFLVGMAMRVLGQHHAIPGILHLMCHNKLHLQQQQLVSTDFFSRILNLTVDMASSHFRKQTNATTKWLNCVLHLTLLSSQLWKKTGRSSDLLRRDVITIKDFDPLVGQEYISTIYRLGYLRFIQERFDEAEQLLRKALECSENNQQQSILSTRMWTYNCLGALFGKRGDLEQCVMFYSFSLKLSIIPNVLAESDRLRRCDWLDRVESYYEQQEEIEQLASFRVEYGALLEERNRMRKLTANATV